jgi:archaeal flagellin FlaB
VERVIISLKRLKKDINADIGVGALIIFIAMIMVAGVTASVMIQTMSSLQQQAIQTSEQTLKEISSGLKITHVSGYIINSKISQLAIFVSPMAASDDIDLRYAMLSLSDSSSKVILNYTGGCFNSGVPNGLFGTLNASLLTASRYGLMVIRDIDGSCTAASPIINEEDLVVILVNTSKCFSGIGTRIDVSGEIYPEQGIRGIIGFTTPSSYVNKIVDLQP